MLYIVETIVNNADEEDVRRYFGPFSSYTDASDRVSSIRKTLLKMGFIRKKDELEDGEWDFDTNIKVIDSI